MRRAACHTAHRRRSRHPLVDLHEKPGSVCARNRSPSAALDRRERPVEQRDSGEPCVARRLERASHRAGFAACATSTPVLRCRTRSPTASSVRARRTARNVCRQGSTASTYPRDTTAARVRRNPRERAARRPRALPPTDARQWRDRRRKGDRVPSLDHEVLGRDRLACRRVDPDDEHTGLIGRDGSPHRVRPRKCRHAHGNAGEAGATTPRSSRGPIAGISMRSS